MLLNSDIQIVIVQMIFQFQKEINVIIFIIEKSINLKFNNFIWTKSQ
jgi:hypothetical protein